MIVCISTLCVYGQHMCRGVCCLLLLLGLGRDFLIKALGGQDRTVNKSPEVTVRAPTHSSMGSRDTKSLHTWHLQVTL